MEESKQNMSALMEEVVASPLVRAAIVEAVHRFYYDRVLSNRNRDQEELMQSSAPEILDVLWNLYPNWREVLLTLPQRYKGADTKAVSIFGKPETFFPSIIIPSFDITILTP